MLFHFQFKRCQVYVYWGVFSKYVIITLHYNKVENLVQTNFITVYKKQTPSRNHLNPQVEFKAMNTSLNLTETQQKTNRSTTNTCFFQEIQLHQPVRTSPSSKLSRNV